ncbi:T9SS type A sorting domain-containing protein [Candidatus Kapabacteria bacterium]|nr:T9SS type A sorting domain-containing protein [Candidatus Kapabacteria bacterium]
MLKILLAFSISSIFIFSQQTGSFDTNILFNGEQRKISMYVPDDYDANTSYRLLVSLHGSGDNSTNLRDVLIGSAGWEGIFENTIFAFLDGGDDQARDFYAPVGDEQFIPTAIDSVKNLYTINNDDIILHGFSLGGRAAFKYGLDHPDDFVGLLLNTPAFQGHLDSENDPNAGVIYNYENASKIPIVITVGELDLAYVNSIRPAYRNLIYNNGKALSATIPNMGHTIPPNNITSQLLDIIYNPVDPGLNYGLLSLEFENDFTCNQSGIPSVEILSIGDEALTNIKFELKNNTTQELKTIEWTGDLKEFQYEKIDLEEISFEFGENDVQINIVEVNGEAVDPSESEDSFVVNREQSTIGTDSFNESFEDEFPSTGWELNESGKQFGFEADEYGESVTDGTNAVFTFNSIFYFYTVGSKEELITPTFNLDHPLNYGIRFSFDYFFKYHSYQLQDGSFANFSDTLSISITDDCGDTWYPVWTAAHDELATADPIVNSNDFNVLLALPLENEWKSQEIDVYSVVNDFSLNESELKLKFTYTSGQGGTFFMDNIKIKELLSVSDDVKTIDNIFPVPATNFLSYELDLEKSGVYNVSISDINGNIINSRNEYLASGVNKLSENFNNLSTGTYFIRVNGEKETFANKFVVK